MPCHAQESAGSEPDVEPEVVEVTALDHAFEAPDEILSGWITFRLINEAEEVHELDLMWLPEGVTYEDFEETISVWDVATERMQASELVGPAEVHGAAYPELPRLVC